MYDQGGLRLNAHSDANWGNSPDNGESTSLCTMLVCNGPVSFKVGIQGASQLRKRSSWREHTRDDGGSVLPEKDHEAEFQGGATTTTATVV